jgi:imidazolonepropionase
VPTDRAPNGSAAGIEGRDQTNVTTPPLLLTHIGELLTLPASGGLGLIHHAAVLIENGRVVFAGHEKDLTTTDLPERVERIDVGGALVTPGLVEPHAHPIFAGSRAVEFDLRARGVSYQEIQARGGGILATVQATCEASDESLISSTIARIDRFVAHGTTTIEAKSGYALSVEGELRLLRLLREVARRHHARLSPTLLAHVPLPDIDRFRHLERLRRDAIPEAARAGLCEAVDVYCDVGAFTLAETQALLLEAKRAGLGLRVHAEQFTRTGAAELAASLGARSVEHLEELSDEAPAALARAGTVCNLLPGAALTLRLKFPDARRLFAAGCHVALGTDCNPGSSLSESQPLMMSLGCTQMGMSCEEAWIGVTRSAARAIGRPDVGHLEPGAHGDVVVWEAETHQEVIQHYGVNLASRVFIAGCQSSLNVR